LIEGNLPFFGRAYSGVGYGGNAGIQFKGEPEDYTITENKKNFMVKAVVKGKGDVYRLNLRIGLEGSANLTITSNNRSAISYTGDISRPEKP
jgi:hypothetical protein